MPISENPISDVILTEAGTIAIPSGRHRLGIVGGMGTSSGLLFQQLLFTVCNARGVNGDQAYPEWIYFNASKIPDRTRSINGEGPSCAPYLVDILRSAQRAAVSAVVVTCNTAHYFYESVHEQVALPWIHLQKETAKHVFQTLGNAQVGIFATEGTVRAQLFAQAFAPYDIGVLQPALGSATQDKISKAIYDPVFGIKSTGASVDARAARLLRQALSELNPSVAIAGCTELSLAFAQMNLEIPWVDPLRVAAETFFDIATGARQLSTL